MFSFYVLLFQVAAQPQFSEQMKILGILASVFAIIQAVKTQFPKISGYWALALNVVLSILAVVVVIQPKDLFSLSTFTTAVIAAIGAAGVHGTWSSLGPSSSPVTTPAAKT